MKKQKPLLVLTPGDPDGIGPEMIWKLLSSGKLRDLPFSILCVGAQAPFARLGAPVHCVRPTEFHPTLSPPKHPGPFVWLLPAPEKAPKNRFLPGFQAGWSIQTATELVQKNIAKALITGPIHKERFQKGGFNFPGHTEFLASLCGTPEKAVTQKTVTMMLTNDQLRITLVTIHVALKDVPRLLTRSLIRQTILNTAEALHSWWGIQKPRIAVAALNPHAGEGGLFGDEEIKIITPEIQELQKTARGRYRLAGPLPADTLFAKHILSKKQDQFDAVVCMYHDQGLIPVKLLDFPRTVNVTLGLPILRTSVDHGVGFDIAGTGKADPSSLEAAIRLAAGIANKKRGK